jgi:hypothetical protein
MKTSVSVDVAVVVTESPSRLCWPPLTFLIVNRTIWSDGGERFSETPSAPASHEGKQRGHAMPPCVKVSGLRSQSRFRRMGLRQRFGIPGINRDVMSLRRSAGSWRRARQSRPLSPARPRDLEVPEGDEGVDDDGVALGLRRLAGDRGAHGVGGNMAFSPPGNPRTDRLSEPPASLCCGIESRDRPTQGIRREEGRLHANVLRLPLGSTPSLAAGSTSTTWKRNSSRRGPCIIDPVARVASTAEERGPIGRTPSTSGRCASPHRMKCFTQSEDVHLLPLQHASKAGRRCSPRGRTCFVSRTPRITHLKDATRRAVGVRLPTGWPTSSTWKNKIDQRYAVHPCTQ